jgi:predicted membrane channel-forming protein YqfA (hemolysin III family)
VHGLLILALGTAAPFLFILQQRRSFGFSLVWIMLQIALSHILAKALFQAKGRYLEIKRAYMLGQMFRWLILIPIDHWHPILDRIDLDSRERAASHAVEESSREAPDDSSLRPSFQK